MEKGVINNKIYVVGHKNPDTDSICSAIAYAQLRTELTGERHNPRRAGQLNEETQYVLDYFNVKAPALLTDLRVQVKDVAMREVEGMRGSVSIKSAWARMKEENLKTLPVTREGKLEGLITIGDIATSYMDVYDSTILATSRTQYRNIATCIEGEIVTGNPHSYMSNGKVGIVASSRKLMAEFVEPEDLVILGNRKEVQQMAIDMGVSCMIVSTGAELDDGILEQAKEKEIVIITTEQDTFTVARLINQSIPIRHFMSGRDGLVSFKMRDYVDDVKEVMMRNRYRDFPVLDNKGKFLGFISRRRLLNCRKKQVILVDHNEKSQAVNGIEQADVLEIIDHHRLSSIETMGPVFFRNQPVGCTATIVYQMYQENGVKVSSTTAGLLCAAIISDTLMFRSPTCTPLDEQSARKLAELAEVDIEMLAQAMFRAGSNLKGKTAEEICFLDFKQFTVSDMVFGVGQVNSMSEEELSEIKEKVLPHLEKARESHSLNMIFFMLTNIITESSELLCAGPEAREKLINAFDLRSEMEELHLKGVVSRKKQLVPALVEALQQ
ncbi:MAG: putative manganese-dependent inorganic diphosphatase [Ruminococcus sp.]|uniref:inorganic diphosphatase n=1 Tax=Schaedlerella arabinosiphila TaxID=2044587 RepID=N2AKZ4_9FIRM|nr:putative manganese-dependent inorganic diphosphatase [Schaedlerella arabinosiphila]MCI8724058.1 putative manganese-dependent inorganic diphosphatase [Ruminococcus sp.]KAI4444375.1 Cobalt-dependent inorganic pyrophosphatase [Schaedlerella arabinosiphila]MCI9603682.1 putative manganese-dependent inorganic diphosphatase [Ruminococcus sp.]MCI9634565.1 putative manganese-dependent inorganic diphosphatase [Ruminococcus sp.]NDO70830.1 putative manganese-dependent inorganic diphosphatase [Schaedler